MVEEILGGILAQASGTRDEDEGRGITGEKT
jgi:hypothetical protein